MLRNSTLKTLATLTILTLVVPVLAQKAQPPESADLPLRTPTPARMPDLAREPVARGERNIKSQEDISQVPLKKCTKKTGVFNFQESEVSVATLTDQVSRALCKNFIIPKNLNANEKVTVSSRNPIKYENLWLIFTTILEANQIALEKVGDFYKLSKLNNDASKKVIPVFERGQHVAGDEGIITYIYAPRNITIQQATTLIGQLSKTTPVAAGEYLVFSDSAPNIRRIQGVLDRVDVAGSAARIHVIEPEHASPSDLKKKIEEIFDNRGSSNRSMNMGMVRPNMQGGSDESSSMKMVADDRTNKLIIIASDKSYERISEMIATLDTPGSGPSNQVSVYHPKNALAKELATTLSTLVGNVAPQGGAQPRPQFSPIGVQEGQFEGQIKVSADEKSNSLLIYSSARDFKSLSQVIDKLDRRRPQVFIEAVIMEVSASDDDNFGLNVFAGLPTGNIPGIGDTLGIVGNAGGQTLAKDVFANFAKTANLGAATQAASSLGSFISTMGILGTSPINIGGTQVPVPSFGAVLNLLERFSTVDILAKPTLTTVDNEKATIEIGLKVPQSTGISTLPGPTGGIGSITNNIQPIDVTNKLEITTHTNENDEVLLEIKQNINDLGEGTDFGSAGIQYTIRKKMTDTRVVTRDQQTVVIGGLIGHNKQHTESKIPWLGDIPILGHAFKNTTEKVVKSNLLLVLTPYIIRSPADNLKIYERKKKEHEDFAKMYFGDKITKFDPYIDYDKKPGPIAKMLHEVEIEMSKAENGGLGLPGDTVIRGDKSEGKGETTLRSTLPEIPVGGSDEPDFSMPTPIPMPVPTDQPVFVEPPATGQVAPIEGAPQEPAPVQPNFNVQPPAGTVPPPNVIVP